MADDTSRVSRRALGSAQVYVLQMVNPEWITRTPDARSVRVLRSLELRGLVYENRGRWYISGAGKEALAALEQGQRASP